MHNEIVYIAENFTFGLLVSIITNKKPNTILIKSTIPYFNNNNNIINTYQKLTQYFFPKIVIREIPNYKTDEKELTDDGLCHQACKESLDYIESKDFDEIIYKIVKPLTESIKDKNILIAVKKSVLEPIFQKILFYKLLDKYSKIYKIDKIFYDTSDIFNISDFLKSNTKNNIVNHNIIENFFKSLFYNFSPFFLRLLLKRKLNFLKIKIKKFDLALQMVWGLPPKLQGSNDDFSNIVSDDEIIKNKNINNLKVVFLNGSKFGRKIDKKQEKEQNDYIKNLGAEFIDESRYKIPLKIFIYDICYKFFKNYILFQLFSSSYYGNHVTAKINQKIYCEYIENKITAKYINTKVFVSKDDYDTRHVTRTIVQNAYDNINVGIQHSAFSNPYIIPFQAYNYFDKYYTQGIEFKNLWAPYWNTNKSNIAVGPQRSHLLGSDKIDEKKIINFKKRFGKKINILLTISSLGGIHSPDWLLKKKYDRFFEILLLKDEINLIFRSRFKDDANKFLSLIPNLKESLNKRIFIVDELFTTQELISLVDIYIAEDNSSAILEAIHIDKLLTIGYRVRYPHQKNINMLTANDFDELKLIISNFVKTKSLSNDYIANRNWIKKNYSMKNDYSCWTRINSDLINYINSTSSL